MLHSIIWPASMLGFCFILFILRRFYYCWHLANQVEDKPPEVEEQRPSQPRQRARPEQTSSPDSVHGNHWVSPQRSADSDDFIAHLEKELDKPNSVRLDHVKVHDDALAAIAAANVPPQFADGSDPNFVKSPRYAAAESSPRPLTPPKEFRTSISDNRGRVPQPQPDVIPKMDKQQIVLTKPGHSEGVIKYNSNNTVRQNASETPRKSKDAKSSVSTSSLPPPKTKSSVERSQLDTLKSPREKDLPPIRGGQQEDEISAGRLTRKQRAQQIREAKRQEQISKLKVLPPPRMPNPALQDINTRREQSEDDEANLRSILQSLGPSTSTPKSSPHSEEPSTARSRNSSNQDKFFTPNHRNAGSNPVDPILAQPQISEGARPKLKPIAPPKPARKKSIDKTSPTVQTPRERVKSPRLGQWSNHSSMTTTPSQHGQSSASSLGSADVSKSSKENGSMDKFLKFSRYTNDTDSNQLHKSGTGRQVPLKPVTTDKPRPVSSRKENFGAPVATRNSGPLKPIPAPRTKPTSDINVLDIKPQKLEWEGKTAKAMEELRIQIPENSDTESSVKSNIPERPTSRSRFYENENKGSSMFKRPVQMYEGDTDSSSQASDEAIPDTSRKYMDSIGSVVPSYYEDRPQASRQNTNGTSRTSKQLGKPNPLPPIEGGNLQILEYITYGLPDEKPKHQKDKTAPPKRPESQSSNQTPPETWQGDTNISHVSYSSGTEAGVSDNEGNKAIMRTSDGNAIDLPLGATVIPGQQGGLSHLSVQDGDEQIILPIPENAQYIVYEYIEEDTTSATVTCTGSVSESYYEDEVCSDEDCGSGSVCHHCGGDRPSPVPMRDDMTVDDL